MTIFEWIIVILVSVLIFLFGLAGVTGSIFFDTERQQNRSEKKLQNKP
ncbi:hypothetical protein [Kangiella profundi]|nr:hypothetical protein [Kangiella profundi]MBD3669115.1 hypothetical protein [Kangiella sp.]